MSDDAVKALGAIHDVSVEISVVLGKTTLSVGQLLSLGRGAVIELDKHIGESVDIYANDVMVARGELVVVEDRLAVTTTEILTPRRR